MSLTSRIRRIGTTLLLLGGLCFSPPVLAQSPSFDNSSFTELWKINPAPGFLDPVPTVAPISRTPRIRLFCIAPGFLADPIGMNDDESTGLPGLTTAPRADLTPRLPESGPDWIQFGVGSDVPNFDLRRPGDPGGFGYYRVNTQLSLLDSPTTACAFGVQAVAPVGAQFGGLPDGPTVFIPAFSVFHALNDRLALQGFVSKNVAVCDAAAAPLQRNVQYGLAFQRPLLGDASQGLRNFYFSVGALGQLAPERDNLRVVPKCDVLPGFQWHVNDNWWLSSALLMPFGPVRATPGQWQLTCSLQF